MRFVNENFKNKYYKYKNKYYKLLKKNIYGGNNELFTTVPIIVILLFFIFKYFKNSNQQLSPIPENQPEEIEEPLESLEEPDELESPEEPDELESPNIVDSEPEIESPTIPKSMSKVDDDLENVVNSTLEKTKLTTNKTYELINKLNNQTNIQEPKTRVRGENLSETMDNTIDKVKALTEKLKRRNNSR